MNSCCHHRIKMRQILWSVEKRKLSQSDHTYQGHFQIAIDFIDELVVQCDVIPVTNTS